MISMEIVALMRAVVLITNVSRINEYEKTNIAMCGNKASNYHLIRELVGFIVKRIQVFCECNLETIQAFSACNLETIQVFSACYNLATSG